MKPVFDHEKLKVYQESLAFCGWVDEFLETVSKKAAVKDQLDRSSTSIPLNIAEGNAKFSSKDRARFFEVACGSALESAACLDVFVAKKLASAESVFQQKVRLAEVVSMLMGLLRRFSPHVDGILREDAPDEGYGREIKIKSKSKIKNRSSL